MQPTGKLVKASEVKLAHGQYVNTLHKDGDPCALVHDMDALRNWVKAGGWESLAQFAHDISCKEGDLQELLVGYPFLTYGCDEGWTRCWIWNADDEISMDPEDVVYGDENGDQQQ